MESGLTMEQAAGPRKVLVVDDSTSSLLLYEFFLTECPVDIIKAEGGTEALARAAEDPPDLVLLDLKMPDMDGLAVLRELRRCARTRDVPVFVLSCWGDSRTVREAYAAGCSDYLAKPVDGVVLKAKVCATLGLKTAAMPRLDLAAGRLDPG